MTAARILPRRAAAETTDPLVQQLIPRRDELLLLKALACAIALHVPLFFLNLPQSPRPPQPPRVVLPAVTIHKLHLKPPVPAARDPRPVRDPGIRKLFVPSAPPEESGPVHEPTPSESPAFATAIAEDLLAEPEAPPPPPGPLESFAPGVVAPVLIPACKVAPQYPELARVARTEGSVVLRAIIRADGSVGDTEVLSARPAGLGFEEAAIDAVLEWCYEPATQNGRPVDVYFTIYVTFRLH